MAVVVDGLIAKEDHLEFKQCLQQLIDDRLRQIIRHADTVYFGPECSADRPASPERTAHCAGRIRSEDERIGVAD
jgi:hypothetical protein